MSRDPWNGGFRYHHQRDTSCGFTGRSRPNSCGRVYPTRRKRNRPRQRRLNTDAELPVVETTLPRRGADAVAEAAVPVVKPHCHDVKPMPKRPWYPVRQGLSHQWYPEP